MARTPTVKSEPKSAKAWFNDPAELKRVREMLGLTQQELAQRAGVKLSFVSDLEADRRKLTDSKGNLLFGVLATISNERRGVNPLEGQNALANLLATTPQEPPSELPADAAENIFKDVRKFVAQFALDKSPEQHLREVNAILEARVKNFEAQLESANARIEGLKAQLKSYEDLCKLQDKRDSWFEPMSQEIQRSTQRIASLESNVTELRSLVGLETTAIVSRSEADELKEKIKGSEEGKDGR